MRWRRRSRQRASGGRRDGSADTPSVAPSRLGGPRTRQKRHTRAGRDPAGTPPSLRNQARLSYTLCIACPLSDASKKLIVILNGRYKYILFVTNFSKPKISCTIPSSHLSFSRSPRARAHRTPPTCGHSHWPRGGRPAGRRDGSSPVPDTHTAHACALAARWRGCPPESHFLRPRSRDTSIGTFWYPPAPAGTTRSRVWSTPFFFPPLPFGCQD